MYSEKALKATNNSGLQPALDWLDAHANDASIDDPVVYEEPTTEETAATTEHAQSIKCNECDKLFSSADLAQVHATKTGHQDFAESTEAIKPLTEEEKKQKLDEIQRRIAEKRQKREEAEKEEQRQNELLRRKAGQDMTEQKEKLKDQMLLREIEKQKREKEDDKRAKQKIKDQIEQDKRDRAVRVAKEKAERDGTSAPTAAAEEPGAPSMLVSGLPKVTSDSNQARLQIRPMLQSSKGGPAPPVTHIFAADQTLKDVIEFVKKEMPHVGSHFKLSMSFPRKDFEHHHESMTLKDLGLVPNAALILTT
ncbi:hypothetical protein GGI03_003094 [Coemansia sp. RSA 2337]|nr:hypothetical protein H4S03_004650 [Coemansia sp. S3946]KAJ2051441.1 hypothetical protein H4S04_001969 [Coemansia sp. S16]KAJ2073889.1 hypothetical protein GGH13_001688 [Coemansia sp. S155-1]KAJ2464668.1 hypothetical protein GGI03_003094 [Coemansia sp. RSA 2337]